MVKLKIKLLGAPLIDKDESAIEFDTRKATALLAYLAVNGEAVARDGLAALLWPEYDQSRAKAALRRTLSTLRKGVGDECIRASRTSIALVQGPSIWVDVLAFQKLVAGVRTHQHSGEILCAQCIHNLAQAEEIYRDDFLAGFGLRDSVEFDDWQFFQSEALRRDLAWILEQLSQAKAAHGDYEQAISFARRWLALDLLREEAHRHLMLLYAWAGQRNASLRQYRECVRILEQELGVVPLDETTQLYQDILANRKSRTRPIAISAPETSPEAAIVSPQSAKRDNLPIETVVSTFSSRDLNFPMVGRTEDWEALLLCHNAAKESGWMVTLEGEAGIGKTRLADEFVLRARSQGVRVFQSRCYQGETNLTFGPIISGLGALFKEDYAAESLESVPSHWLVEIGRLLPEIHNLIPDLPEPPSLDNPGAQGRFFEGIRQVLLAMLAGKLPGILLLDDLHWADKASLDLLAYIVHRLELTNLLLILTWREGSTENAARILQMIAEAQRARRATRLHLERLDENQIDQLVNAIPELTDSGNVSFSQRLFQESEGLPFFAIAFIESAMQAGLPQTGESMRLTGDIRNLLLAQIAALDSTANQLLGTAAVIGRSFDYPILREASGRSDAETIGGLATLLNEKIIRESKPDHSSADATYDFSHEKLRQLVYEDIFLARRQLLHRRVAEALISSPHFRGDLGNIAGSVAYHYQHSGEMSKAAEYFTLAGDHARALFANEAALEHYLSALASGPADACRLHESIGDVQTLMGKYDHALMSYERTAALSNSNRLPEIEIKLGNIHHRRGDYELAICHFQAAIEGMDLDKTPAKQAHIYADWSRSLHHLDDDEQALDLAQKSLQLAEQAGDPESLAKAYNILGILARSHQNLQEARQHLEKSLAYSENVENQEAKIAALNNLALVHAEDGESHKAIDYTKSALEFCEQIGDRHRSAALYNHLADLHHHAGEHEIAMEYLKQAVKIFGEIEHRSDDPRPQIWMLIEW